MKSYRYLGPVKEMKRAGEGPKGHPVYARGDLDAWLTEPGRETDPSGSVTATFIVDAGGRLFLAPRRSEHVMCAGGGPVLSAGEMTFSTGGDSPVVTDVSNQSAGFCPEPESWHAVGKALDEIGLLHPGRFTREILFRLCPCCGQKNIVKGDVFCCGNCGFDLPREWNFDPPAATSKQPGYELWREIEDYVSADSSAIPYTLTAALKEAEWESGEKWYAVRNSIRGELLIKRTGAGDLEVSFDPDDFLPLAMRDFCILETWRALKTVLKRLAENRPVTEEEKARAISEFRVLLHENLFVRGKSYYNQDYILGGVLRCLKILRGLGLPEKSEEASLESERNA